MTHDEIAEVAFHTIRAAHEEGITDPLRLAHAVAYGIKLAEADADPRTDLIDAPHQVRTLAAPEWPVLDVEAIKARAAATPSKTHYTHEDIWGPEDPT